VRTVASIIGGLIIVHAVFVLFGANPTNVLVQLIAGIRDSFGLAPASKPKDDSKKKRDDTPRSTPVQKSRPTEKPKAEAPAPQTEAAPQAEHEPEPADESGSSLAKHQATSTSREDERAGDKAKARAQALRTAAADCRPSSSTDTCRISTLRILPVTVIGNSSTTLT
jgi:hypothetical protein